MFSCNGMDYDSPEDNAEEDESYLFGDSDLSSSDDPVDSPQQPLAQCDASHSPHSDSPWPLTSRVLFHPSFEAHYAAVAIQQHLETPEMQLRREEGFTANPGEYFYTDPLLSPGHRVYNCLSPGSHSVFGCFRLQTPPPIMASCVFPSADEDALCDGEDLGEPINIGDVLSGPLLHSEDVPQCVPSPVLGSDVMAPRVPSPTPYSTLELQAACALLWLSAPPPAHITS
ncbi:histone deacetylase complex subunit SAP25 [Anomaloglossus baeobatrachus]|uniref:histone deacetylase complex subunit SAP25 n=1 Tax=Anomaloglossus baeobatrachus TaxID=238106 RepID=UPI003F50D238